MQRWLIGAVLLAFICLTVWARLTPHAPLPGAEVSTSEGEPPLESQAQREFRTLLQQASWDHRPGAVSRALQRDPSLARQQRGYYPLHEAIVGGNYPKLYAMTRGTRGRQQLLHRLSEFGMAHAPLEEPWRSQQDAAALAVLGAGGDPLGVDESGLTALHLAIMVCSPVLLDAVLKAAPWPDPCRLPLTNWPAPSSPWSILARSAVIIIPVRSWTP